jgi:5-keto 4-deoxyuronate isomerase
MFAKTYHATHPDMMEGVSNEALRDRYLVTGMFVAGEVNLNYSHNERFVIGGAVPVPRPGPARQTAPASAAGHSLLERREMGVVNIGGPGFVTVDGQRFALGNKECLYVPMGSEEVVFEGEGARFYLASTPAHKALPIKHIPLDKANPLARATSPIPTSARSTSSSSPACARARSSCSASPCWRKAACGTPCRRTCMTAAARSISTSIWRKKTTACSTTWASPTACATS